MTIIVGYVDRDLKKMYMFGDSQGTNTWFQSKERSDDKIFRKGDMLFGFTSSYRMGQLLKYKLDIPMHPEGMSDLHYIHTLFLDSIISCFENNGYQHKSNEVKTGGTFLFGYHGEIFKVQNDYQIERTPEPYNTCGCGEDLAMGALNIIINYIKNKSPYKYTPLEIGTAAIETAIKYSAGCGGHITSVEMEY